MYTRTNSPFLAPVSTRNPSEYASIGGRGSSSSSSENKIKRKNNKNGEEMRSLCRFSRAIPSLPNSQSFWELYRKIQKRNGRLSFAIRVLWDVASFGERSSKAPDKMALTKEDRSYGNSLFYRIRMLPSYFHWNFASKKRSLPRLFFSPKIKNSISLIVRFPISELFSFLRSWQWFLNYSWIFIVREKNSFHNKRERYWIRF